MMSVMVSVCSHTVLALFLFVLFSCTDIDDALHCRKLPSGNYELGVHIADVSSSLGSLGIGAGSRPLMRCGDANMVAADIVCL